tara:strand:- start:843 stop:2249 length:1407 start_codon:yes stop_codon:yes gene_type:complete
MFNQGGEVSRVAEVPEQQMQTMMSMPPMREVAQNPEKFLKDPNSVRTAEETRQVYEYNRQILDLASSLPQFSKAAEGGVQGAEPVVAEGGPVGFVDQAPENLEEATTVADDVPMEVAEGTFVINAAAVEVAGSDDIKKMLLEAMDEARKQGLDSPKNVNTIDRENAISLLVSRGEVIVPPLLAKIIGYDRLNKINNRGKEEVQKRVEENGQSPEAEALDEQPKNPSEGMTMSGGGFVNPRDDELLYSKAVLEAVEGMSTQAPHVPSDSSGLTIGTGLDLGQHSEFDLRERYGLSEKFIKKAGPFLAKDEGKKGPLGTAAKELYNKLNTDFTEESEVASRAILNKKYEEFEQKYNKFEGAVPKDKATLFSMYYVGGLDRYKTLQDVYEKTGDMPRAIDEGLLRVIKDKESPEYNRAVNLLTFYYTADDADVLANRNAGQQKAYAMDMLKTQRADRKRIEKQKKEGSFLD